MKFSEWEKSVERGTSGDMVWDILSDWKAQVKLTREGLLQSLKNIKPLGDEEIDKIIGKQLHKDGVYIAETLDITLTIFQLLAIIQASRKDYERQLKEMIG